MFDKILSVIDYFFDSEDKVQLAEMRNESKKRSEDLVLAYFIKALKANSNKTIDELIVEFEGGEGSLEDYAKSRSRSVKSYRKSYSEIYERAKATRGRYGTF